MALATVVAENAAVVTATDAALQADAALQVAAPQDAAPQVAALQVAALQVATPQVAAPQVAALQAVVTANTQEYSSSLK
jgi:hypothetical protein